MLSSKLYFTQITWKSLLNNWNYLSGTAVPNANLRQTAAPASVTASVSIRVKLLSVVGAVPAGKEPERRGTSVEGTKNPKHNMPRRSFSPPRQNCRHCHVQSPCVCVCIWQSVTCNNCNRPTPPPPPSLPWENSILFYLRAKRQPCIVCHRRHSRQAHFPVWEIAGGEGGRAREIQKRIKLLS